MIQDLPKVAEWFDEYGVIHSHTYLLSQKPDQEDLEFLAEALGFYSDCSEEKYDMNFFLNEVTLEEAEAWGVNRGFCLVIIYCTICFMITGREEKKVATYSFRNI